MEHQNQKTYLKLSDHNFERFADTDTLLRGGMHVQNHKSQIRNFQFLEDNFNELFPFYEELYQIKLCSHISSNEKFYFLDYFDEQKSKLKKDKLDSQVTLFSIFLYFLHKVEKRFSFTLTKSEIIETLNTHHKIKPHIQRLFLGSDKEETNTTLKTLEKWVNDSLRQLEKIGWVYFLEEETEKFEILPAFERISLIYRDAINNIDEIKTTHD